MAKSPRRATSRRTPTAKNGVAGRRVRAAGVMIAPTLLRHKATTLRTINAANILSFSRRATSSRLGEIHGFKTVNAPGSGRKSTNVSPALHGINAPKGRY